MAVNRQILILHDLAFNGLVKHGLFSSEFEFTPLPGVKDPETHEVITLPLEYQQDCISEIVVQIAVEKLLPKLLKAIIDDDRKTVKEMLDAMPQLLLLTPTPDCVIESQKTWKKFYAEGALKMAVKQKQIKMIKLLVPYFDKLPQSEDVINARTEALSHWKFCERLKSNYGEEIIVPREYDLLAESLYGVIREEIFPNDISPINLMRKNIELSDSTELALSSLLNLLVPRKAVMLDECIDTELLLFALYKSYVDFIRSLDSYYYWNRQDALSIRVIGLIQSALIPEMAEIFCEGFDDVFTDTKIGKGIEIGLKASKHKLKGDEGFYRDNRDSQAGLGFELFSGIYGVARWNTNHEGTELRRRARRFGKSMLNKDNEFSEYYAALAATARTTRCTK